MAQQTSNKDMIVRFWGTRGSIPTPGNQTLEFGGNTACIEVQYGDHGRIVFDAGSGIRLLGDKIMREKKGTIHIDLLFSHFHWDHIQGLPFFLPFYVPDSKIDIWGADSAGMSLEQILDHQMHTAFHPVSLSELKAKLRLHKIDGNPLTIDGAKVTMCRNRHPGYVLAFRVDFGGHSMVYATDREPDPMDVDASEAYGKQLIELANNADLIIHDAQYSDEEYQSAHVGWGHSPFSEAIRIARATNTKKLFLFHHDPNRHDDILKDFEKELQQGLRPDDNFELEFAREGKVVRL